MSRSARYGAIATFTAIQGALVLGCAGADPLIVTSEPHDENSAGGEASSDVAATTGGASATGGASSTGGARATGGASNAGAGGTAGTGGTSTGGASGAGGTTAATGGSAGTQSAADAGADGAPPEGTSPPTPTGGELTPELFTTIPDFSFVGAFGYGGSRGRRTDADSTFRGSIAGLFQTGVHELTVGPMLAYSWQMSDGFKAGDLGFEVSWLPELADCLRLGLVGAPGVSYLAPEHNPGAANYVSDIFAPFVMAGAAIEFGPFGSDYLAYDRAERAVRAALLGDADCEALKLLQTLPEGLTEDEAKTLKDLKARLEKNRAACKELSPKSKEQLRQLLVAIRSSKPPRGVRFRLGFDYTYRFHGTDATAWIGSLGILIP